MLISALTFFVLICHRRSFSRAFKIDYICFPGIVCPLSLNNMGIRDDTGKGYYDFTVKLEISGFDPGDNKLLNKMRWDTSPRHVAGGNGIASFSEFKHDHAGTNILESENSSRKSVIYVYPQLSSFVKKDIAILSEKYDVKVPAHNWSSKSQTPFNFVRQLFFLVKKLKGSKAIFIMFAGYWSLLPSIAGRMTGIPVYIIPGGTDCVSFPSLNYGSLRKPVMRTFIKWSFQLCSMILPVDRSLVFTDYTYLEYSDYRHQGYKYFFPAILTPWRVIHNGFDPEYFTPGKGDRKPGSFVVLASVDSRTRAIVKGIDTVLKLAAIFPLCTFTIIGITEKVLFDMGSVPANVRHFPFLDKEDFRNILQESQFVLQLSVSEGFPNALCEAMLSGCVPVGSSVGAIPEIIGDTGFIMYSSATGYLKEKLEMVISSDTGLLLSLSEMARQRIAVNYHINKRAKAFTDLIEAR